MLSVTSHRHFVRFYLAILALVLFFAVMAAFVFVLHGQAINKFGEYVLWAMGGGCVVAVFYIPYKYVKNTPVISVDMHQISFNSKIYNWSDIETITLTGKMPFKQIFTEHIEGAMFKFKDGSVEYAFDRMYTNLWKIKQFIEQVVIEKKQKAEISKTLSGGSTEFEVFDYYKGIIGFQGAISISTIVAIWGLVLTKGKDHFSTSFKPLLFITLFVLYLTSYLWYYFGVSSNYLVVRNKGFFWVRTVYGFAGIREVVIETKQKRPNGLRIITKDFRTKLYYAESLTDKKWRELKAVLESHHIKVRVETYIGKD